MHIVILGGGGMVGQKLLARLARDGHIAGKAITSVLLHDVVEPVCPAAPFTISTRVGDLSSPGEAEAVIQGKPDLVFHLAAIVSGEAEADFAKGYRINFVGYLVFV